MRRRMLATALLVPALAAAGCGSNEKNVDTATYTCGQFAKSLQTKGDDTSGNFINQLRKKAKLNQSTKVERREITLGIYFTCRSEGASARPADGAIRIARQIKAGKFKLPAPPSKKKSNK